MSKRYAKLFYDFEAAQAFAEHVEHVANGISVPAGKAGRPYSIFAPMDINKEPYCIEQDIGSNQQNIFYVQYAIGTPKGASHADMILAERQATEYLNEKYAELGPDVGRSLA